MKSISKKILLALAVISMLAVMLVMSVSAENVTGTYATGHVAWSIDENGVCTITPLDTMTDGTIAFNNKQDNSANSATIFAGNKDKIKEVIIENTATLTITKISGSPDGLTNCVKITYPDTVVAWSVRPSGYGFSGCAALTTIGSASKVQTGVVDASIMSLVNDWSTAWVFNGCSSMTDIILPDNFGIGRATFKNCSSLKSITLPANCTSTTSSNADHPAFENCTALETVIFRCSGNVTTSADDFKGCENITTIKGGSNNTNAKNLARALGAEYEVITLLPPDATVYTADATEWTIDTATGVVTVKVTADNTTGIAKLQDYAASGTTTWKAFQDKYKAAITKVSFVNVEGRPDIVHVDARITGCTSLETIEYPATVTKVQASAGGWMFQGNTSLKTFGPAGTLTGTCDLSALTAFGNTTNLFTGAAFEKVITPKAVQHYYGNEAFKDCKALKEVILSANTKQLSPNMFAGCTSLEKLVFLGSGVYKNYGGDTMLAGVPSTCVVYGPIDSTANYGSDTQGAGAIGVANKFGLEFRYHSGNGNEIFTYAEGGIEWTISKDLVVTVRPTAENEDGVLDFANPYISNEDRENGATENAWQIFLSKGNKFVKKVVIENVEGRTEAKALKGTISFETLTSITFPKTVDTIYGRASGGYTYNGKALTTFGPVGTPEGTCDLSGVTLASADFQDGYYHRSMFNGADFTTVILPDDLTSVVESMFENCEKITEVTIPGSVKNIYTKAFKNCTALTTVNVLCDPVIAADAFDGCTALTALNAQPGTEAAAYAEANGLTCTTPAGAAAPSGAAGDGVKWTFDLATGVLTISGNGEITSLDGVRYAEKATSIIIGSGVTAIADNALTALTALESATFNGNAPAVTEGTAPFGTPASAEFAVYCKHNATGFEGDTWCGYALVKSNVTPGDANGDGAVDGADAVLLAQHLAKWNVEIDLAAADVDGSGAVDSKDAVRLAQYLAKWDVELAGAPQNGDNEIPSENVFPPKEDEK